jgi:hypothetical protein
MQVNGLGVTAMGTGWRLRLLHLLRALFVALAVNVNSFRLGL